MKQKSGLLSINKCIISLFAAMHLLFSVQQVHATDLPSPGELFRQVEERFTAVGTLSYTVKRLASSKKQAAEDRWLFRFKTPDKVRIDYLEPYNRVIVADGTNLVEYVPVAHKAIKTDLSAVSPEKRKKILSGVFKRLSVDGLRLGNYEEMLRRAVKVTEIRLGERDAWLVEGATPRYLVYIDREKLALLRTEIYAANGELVLRTESSAFIEASRGFWLPREIITDYHTSEGFYRTTVKLSEVRVNDVIADRIFQFAPPAGVEIITSEKEDKR